MEDGDDDGFRLSEGLSDGIDDGDVGRAVGSIVGDVEGLGLGFGLSVGVSDAKRVGKGVVGVLVPEGRKDGRGDLVGKTVGVREGLGLGAGESDGLTVTSSGNLGLVFFALASSHVTGCTTSNSKIKKEGLDNCILILYTTS